MKMRRLDREYAACINSQIKTNPNEFKGLANMLAEDEESEEEFGEF